MMKKYICILITMVGIVLPIVVGAQTNPLELKDVSYYKFNYPYRYTRYPDTPLGDEYKTIYVEKAVLDTVINKDKVFSLLRTANIAGFKTVGADEQPDLRSKITIQDVRIHKPISTINEINNGKSGISIEENFVIKYEIKYSVELYDLRKDTLLYQYNKALEKGEWKGQKQYHKGDAIGQEEARRIADQGVEQAAINLEEMIASLSTQATLTWSDRYGTHPAVANVSYYHMGDKKHYETFFYSNELKLFKDTYKALPSSTRVLPRVLTGDTKQPDRFIRYNESLIEKYKDATPKVLVKIASTGYYNIATIYLWDEKFDLAREYAQKGLETGEMKKEFEEIFKTIDSHINYLKKHNVTTRY